MRMTPDDIKKTEDEIMDEMVVCLYEEGYTKQEIQKFTNYQYTLKGVEETIKKWYA